MERKTLWAMVLVFAVGLVLGSLSSGVKVGGAATAEASIYGAKVTINVYDSPTTNPIMTIRHNGQRLNEYKHSVCDTSGSRILCTFEVNTLNWEPGEYGVEIYDRNKLFATTSFLL